MSFLQTTTTKITHKSHSKGLMHLEHNNDNNGLVELTSIKLFLNYG